MMDAQMVSHAAAREVASHGEGGCGVCGLRVHTGLRVSRGSCSMHPEPCMHPATQKGRVVSHAGAREVARGLGLTTRLPTHAAFAN